MSERELAQTVMRTNILDMAITFTAMMRVFASGSKDQIAQKLHELTLRLDKITSAEDYERIHKGFCEWFCAEIFTAKKKVQNKSLKPSRLASYGQAAKVLDIVMKVYVHYCYLPNAQVADRLRPLLHGAVDTPIMKYLKGDYPDANIGATTVEQINERTYRSLQELIARDIQRSFHDKILPVQYDDIMWQRLNRDTGR